MSTMKQVDQQLVFWGSSQPPVENSDTPLGKYGGNKPHARGFAQLRSPAPQYLLYRGVSGKEDLNESECEREFEHEPGFKCAE